MLRAGYSVQLSAGAITAGGCLGILIPPSVLLIVYGATAGVSVVQLYAGAFFPGLMLAGLYIVYVIILAKLKPQLAPPLSRRRTRCVPLPPPLEQRRRQRRAGASLPALLGALKGRRNHDVPTGYLLRQLFVALLPALLFVVVSLWSYQRGDQRRRRRSRTQDCSRSAPARPAEPGGRRACRSRRPSGGLQEPPLEAACRSRRRGGGLSEPPSGGGLSEPPRRRLASRPPPRREPPRPPRAAGGAPPPRRRRPPAPSRHATARAHRVLDRPGRRRALALAIYYLLLSFARLEIFKMLLSSLLPAADPDPGGARLDRVRPRDADRGGRRRRARRLPARRRLPAAEPDDGARSRRS